VFDAFDVFDVFDDWYTNLSRDFFGGKLICSFLRF